jgi:hypothetical protein
MGFFGTYEFSESGWSPGDPEGPSTVSFGLWVDIHDSDFATIKYTPAGPGTGAAYLGYTPLVYFDVEDASVPTDTAREALGLATWAAALGSSNPDVDLGAKQAALATFLASDDVPIEDREIEDDADVFVEIKTAQLLVELGLPLPDELSELAG